MQIFEYPDTVSTNLEAKRLYEGGQAAPFWVRADRQSGGKGRRGRDWVSKTGNLYASGVYPWRGSAQDAAKLSFVAALAVCQTLEAYALKTSAQLKWPNDVLLGGGKVSGILLENLGDAIIVGIGINLVSHPEGTPYPATHLLEHIKDEALNDAETIFTGAPIMLPLLAKEFGDGLSLYKERGFAPIAKDWRVRAKGLGEMVTVNLPSESFTAAAMDLREDGALRVRLDDGTIKDIHAGDVFFPNVSEG